MFELSGIVALTLVARLGAGEPGIDANLELDVEPGLHQVSIERARWEALRAVAELADPAPALPGPQPTRRSVELERRADGVRVRASWSVVALEAGWLSGPLIGPVAGMRVESTTWRNRGIGVTHGSAGDEVSIELEAGERGTLELVAFIPAESLLGGVDGAIDLWLMPAASGELHLSGLPGPEGQVPELTIVTKNERRRLLDDQFWVAEGPLHLDWVRAPQTDEGARRPLAVARAAIGLTFGDGEVRGRARVSWLLRQGSLASVSLDAAGLGRDLELAGPNVLEWSRRGERIEVTLREPATGRVDLDLRWTQGLASGDAVELVAPRINPGQAYRSESFMQIARDGELEIVPKLAGWSALAQTELPDWAGGYIQGTATASYQREGKGGSGDASFELLRFVPLSGPPVMVDVAAYEIATTDEGRSLIQARYDVRNEQASHLGLRLPAGARMLGIRVNGETATPTRNTDGSASETWRIPLVRSLESVEGSLSFPVEVIFITETDDWANKEERELALPALDAPVAVSRVRVYLPPRYQNRVDSGDHHRVDSFSEGEGITYGLGLGVGSEAIARADELYREAQSAWMSNDFERAQSSLDELSSLGASNTNIAGLQANLDLVQGKADAGGDADRGPGETEGEGDAQAAVVSRRIKDQARQRAVQDEIELRERVREAEELEAQGQYGMAEQRLAEAQEIGEQLARLEQSESKEQVAYNQRLSASSARIAEKKVRKTKREAKTKTKRPAAPSAAAIATTPVVPEPAPPAEPEPPADVVPEAIVEFDIESDGARADVSETIVVELEQAKQLPVGEATGRDFTAVIDVAPGVAPAKQRRTGKRGGKARAAPANDAAGPPPRDPNAALAGPVATASAVSVHIPAIGEAVLYQYMLVPEGKPLTVHLQARRNRRERD